MGGVHYTCVDAAGDPCEGSVVFTPLDDSGGLDDETSLGGSKVLLELDEDGEFSIDLRGGRYRVEIRLANANTVTREITVPVGGDANLRWLLAGPTATPGEASQAFTAAGPYAYTIPWWATRIDIVLNGAGGGGDNGAPSTAGDGGGAGAIATRTLIRGTDISWDATTISGAVGAGGARDEGNGTSTTAAATGMDTLTAAGGTGGAATGPTGASPGDTTYNGVLYKGGATQPTRGAAGKAPGGGGGGGNTGSGLAGPGADGAAFFRAYQ